MDTDSWKDQVPKISVGNAFDSDDLWFCKAGSIFPLRSEEAFQRATEVVESYPRNFRILRYEGRNYEPCLYNVYVSVDVADYVFKGIGEIPRPTEERR